MENDRINSYQFMALAFVCTLSPIIHTMPDSAAKFAGERAWLSCCLAVLPCAGLCFLMAGVMRRSHRGGLCRMMRCNLGDAAGRVLCLLFWLWLMFLAGFILRAEGQRFVSTAYPLADPKIFAAVSLLLCVPAVLGQFRSIARTAMLLRPILAIVLLAVFLSALRGVNLHGLWQPGRDEIGSICTGALPAAEPLCFCLYILFFAHRAQPPKAAQYAGLILCVTAVSLLLTVTVLGSFGTQLCLKIYAPFFSMVRDLELFGDVDRIEAVVTAVWIFSDFVLASLLLSAGAECLGNVIPPLAGGKIAGLITCSGALAVSLLLAPTSRALERFTGTIVPAGNVIAAAVILLVMLTGQIRKTDFG